MKICESILTEIAALAGLRPVWKRVDGHGVSCGLGDGFTYHRNPFCEAVKQTPERLKLCSLHDNQLLRNETEQRNGEPFRCRCHAGVSELAIPVPGENGCRELMLFGVYREKNTECPYPELSEAFTAIPEENSGGLEAIARIMRELTGVLKERRDALRLDIIAREIHDPRILRAAEAIRRNPGGHFSVAELAGEACLSESRFIHLFRQETGLSLTAYLKQEHFREAKRLLRESELTIQEVALAAGFHDQSHLGRVFREFTQNTPRAYRRRYSRPQDS